MKKKFYCELWVMVLALIIFPPLGIFLMWKFHSEISDNLKIIITVVCSVFFLYMFLFRKSTPKYDWPNDMVIPKPSIKYGKIYSNSNDYFSLTLYKATDKDFKNYVNECKKIGFTIETESDDDSFSGYNKDGYELNISYHDYSDEISITVNGPKNMSIITWPSSDAGNSVDIPDSNLGSISYDKSDGFALYLGNISKDNYNEYVQKCIDKGYNIDYSKSDKHYYAKNSNGYEITLDYEGANVIFIKIVKIKSDNNFIDEKPSNSNVSSDFKTIMDTYEAFFDEYISFMKEYKSTTNVTPKMINDYADFLTKYSDYMDKLNDIDTDELTASDYAYYTEVMARITKKLSEV